MSHQDFAAIWLTLQGRLDIDNIVQELTGRYFLESSKQKSDPTLYRATSFAHVVALRAIFDLQRTYLQSSNPSFETKSSILDPRILFSTLSHLLEIKASAFSAQDGLPDHEAYCSFIGQTQLSGLRALLLQSAHITGRDYEDFTLRLSKAWNRETLRGVDLFVDLLCRQILSELCNGSKESHRQYCKPACGLVNFQDFDRGLCPIEDHDNTLMNAVRNASSASPISADWFLCALMLYDTMWSTVAAMIQLCIDSQGPKDPNHWSFDAARLTLVPRFKILDQIYRHSKFPTTPQTLEWAQEQTKSLICSGLHPSCFGPECTCLGDNMTGIQHLWKQHISQQARNAIDQHLSHNQYLEVEPSLKEFQAILEERHSTLPVFATEIKHISQKISDDIQDWYPKPPRGSASNKHTPPDDVFLMGCPELHPIPGKDLLRSLKDHSFEGPQPANLSLAEIRLLKDFPANITCNQCAWTSSTISARKVEPLSKLSEYIQEKLRSQRKIAKSRIDRLSSASNLSTLPSHPKILPLRCKGATPRSQIVTTEVVQTTPINTGAQNPRPMVDVGRPTNEQPNRFSTSPRSLPRAVNEGRMSTRSPSLRKPPSVASTYIGSTSSPLIQASTMSRSSSRSDSRQGFSPLPFPSQAECTTLPEVVEPLDPFRLQSPKSVRSSDAASTQSYQSPKYQERKPWSIFKSKGPKTTSSTTSYAFFTSGRSLVVWNDAGAICYDLENRPEISVRVVEAGDILLAAGGTRKYAVVSRMGSVIILRSYQDSIKRPFHEMELEEVPFKMAISSNDHYLALKFGTYVRILDTLNGALFHHKLPTQNGRCGQNDHLVSFSTDCLSFIACTRYEPEKVISYHCECQTPANFSSVESSAPSGLVSDSGLSSILLTSKSAFLTTFTERGYPTYLSFHSSPSAHILRDKDLRIGSRIHKAALCATGQNLVLLNDRNQLFWMANPFGKEQAPIKIGQVKRQTSVKREVEVAMPGKDEVNVFWVEKGKGVLVTVGLGGGKSRPVEIGVDVEQILAAEHGF